MSGFLTSGFDAGSPLSLLDPTQDEINRRALHGQAVLATGLPVGLLAAALPDPNASGIAAALPFAGAASQLVGAVGSANDLTTNLLNRILPQSLQLPVRSSQDTTNIFNQADAIANATRTQAEQIVPHVEPTNLSEQLALDTGEAAGSMGVPVPGAVAERIPGLVKAVMPGLHGIAAPVIAGGITGAAGEAMQPNQHIADQTDMTAPSPISGALPTPPIPPSEGPPPLTRVSNPVPQFPISPVEVHVPFDDMLNPQNEWTWGQRALYGAGAIAVLMAGPRILSFLRDFSGSTSATRYAEASLPYNTQQADFAANNIPRTDAPLPAPLPGRAGDASTALAVATKDRNAGLNAFTDATASSPSVAKELRAQTGMINNEMAFRGRFENIASSGEDPATGIKMPSIADHFNKIADGTPQQQAAYNGAREAADELDNRVRNMTNKQVGSAPTSVKYQDWSDLQLGNEVAAARADPVVASWMDERQQINRAKLDILEQNGMLTAAEKVKLLSDHPNYLPSADVSGLIENPLRARNITPGSGADFSTTPVWELDKQHDESIFKAVEQNMLRRDFIQNAYANQQANPGAAQIFKESRDAAGNWVAKADGSSLPVRINGELQHHIVDSPQLRTWIAQPAPVMGAVLGGLNAARAASQSAITGTGAALVGHWYAPTGAIRYALTGSTIRPAGTAGSYLDKGLQLATGGRLALRGDPSAVLTMPYEWGAAVGANGALRMASILDPAATNIINTKLRSVLRGSVVDAMHNRLQALWYNSIRAQMLRNGAANAAGYSSVPIPSMQSGAYQYNSSVLNNMAPRLFRTNGYLGKAMPYFVNVNSLLNSVKSIISEGAHAQYYRLNPQLSPTQRAYNTRNLVGDPGVRGASPWMSGYNAVTNYGNIALQEASAQAKSFRDNPATFVMAKILGLGIPALASIYTAMMHGPDAINHMYNELTDAQSAQSVRIYLPGQPVEDSAQIPIGVNDHAFYPWVKALMMDVIGLQSHSENPGLAQWAMDGMHDLFSEHGSHSAVTQTMAGLSSAIMPFPATELFNTFSGLAGKSFTPTLDNAYQMRDQAPNTTKMFFHDIAGDPRAPGRIAGGDTLTGTAGGNIFHHLITSALGIVGSAIDSEVNTFHAAMKATGDASYAIGNMAQDYTGRLQESLPFLNGIVWNHDDRLATQTPLVQRVEQSLDALRPFQNWKGDLKWNGLTRAKGIPLPGQSFLPTEDQGLQMLGTAGTYMQIMEKYMLPQIQDIRKEMATLNSSPMPPVLVRQMHNQYVRQMQGKYEEVASTINELNDRLSTIAGKRITVRDLFSLMQPSSH